ncbi:MAG: autotransporter outer membrane beta-barrel domain-containing protein, partial [Candidatus Accumulibacter sp.]|nr:autotransporter outer membrane beta-barrel domain-containing protein [Accumulibacter sp.]
FGLSWNVGSTTAHGTFTVTDSFEVDIPLAEVAANPAKNWDGKSLPKYGDGTLILSAANTYSGDTTVSGGTLKLTDTGSLTNNANVIVEGGGIFDLSGKLSTGNITIKNGAFFNITGTELTVNGMTDVQSGGTLDLVNHSGLLDLGPSSSLRNAGLVRLNNPSSVGNTLKVGAYEGDDGTQALNTVLGGDDSLTDKLHVTGNVTGSSLLAITNVGGTGAQTVNGIQVVQVGGQSAGKFFLASSLRAGLYEYFLTKGNDGSWYLTSLLQASVPSIEAQRINAETGFLQLANLSQRVGEHRDLPLELQSWARTYRSQGSEDGKRGFGYDQDTTGVQVGHELLAKSTGNGGTLRAAIAFDYARTDADFNDRARPALNQDKDTGSVKAESYALGAYLTHTTANGAYVDLVVQTAKLHNDFTTKKTGEPHDKATQKGWRAGFSLEGGYPLWKIDNAWLLEGQAQLSYQYTKYQGFKDATFKVDKYDADTLRGRIGARLVRDLTTAENKPLKLYGLVNVHHDFLKPESVTFVNLNDGGSTPVSERYGKSWGELGVGIQGWADKSTSVFGDVRYQHGFSSPDKGDAREGGSVNVGARFRF